MAKEVLVEISARHDHVTDEALEILFGKGHKLTPKKDLSQPGQFACEERVSVVGPKRELKNVSILGPVRPETQVELSATDARSIGISAPVRESGDISGSAPCKIVGPCGEIEISEGVIIAKRHIHMTPEDAAGYGLSDKQVVKVNIQTPERSLCFGDVVVRVKPTFRLAMHIDTDYGKAAGASGTVYGDILDCVP